MCTLAQVMEGLLTSCHICSTLTIFLHITTFLLGTSAQYDTINSHQLETPTLLGEYDDRRPGCVCQFRRRLVWFLTKTKTGLLSSSISIVFVLYLH